VGSGPLGPSCSAGGAAAGVSATGTLIRPGVADGAFCARDAAASAVLAAISSGTGICISVPELRRTDHRLRPFAVDSGGVSAGNDMSETAVCTLEDLGVLALRGPDVRSFLQGQLSADVATLGPGTLLRAGLHNPQGRTLAVLALLAGAEQEVLALLPRELLASTLATLQRYVLRAKLAISNASERYRLYGLTGGTPELSARGIEVPYHDTRRLRLVTPDEAAPSGQALARSAWRLADIAAGLPQLYAPTSGQFVAQMINLDCIGAVSFSKGCYTGQEVIARAHYRGRVKRRMQRFLASGISALAPGDVGRLPDGRGVRVIEAASRTDGSVEFLAVSALPGAAPGAPGTPGTPEERATGPAEGAALLPARPLPLPYELPD
jgi:tRNA-modifying protein YgfZ